MKTKSTSRADRLPKSFEGLNTIRPLWPIKDDVDYENSVELLNRLAVLDKRTSGQDQYLETLTLLVEAYDNEHHNLDTSHLGPIDSLKYLMEQRGMTGSDLGRLLGNRALGARILSGARQLSKDHIRKLCRYFGVSADTFI